MNRYAVIRGNGVTKEKVAAYLPANYCPIWNGYWTFGKLPIEEVVVIEGRDIHGWTLHNYIQPRLGSGLMMCEEIDLSHPLMKLISGN